MRRMVGVWLTAVLAAVVGCSAAPAPATGYYAPIDGLAGAELKAALTALISEHTTLSYRGLWDYYPTTYYVPSDPSQVLDMYSSSSFSFSAHSGMDREHVIPKSWWGGSTDYGPGCDLYNVIPAEHAANEAKSNYPFGVVQDASTFDNGVIRVGHFSTSGYAGRVFEPADEYKGDFARIAFYVATCYPDMPWDEHKAKMMTSATGTLQPWCIPILLSWSRSDAVDAAEIQRNEDVSKYQGNRNPFIDYPDLAEYIWGDKQHEPFYLSAHTANTGVANDNVLPPVSPSRSATTPAPADIDSRYLLYETFAAITAGNNDSNNGSSTAWQGNDNFPTGSKMFKAGQALRIGTSTVAGSLTSRPLATAAGGSVTVSFDVKGWTTVEGLLLVTVTGAGTQSVRYTATMGDTFEHCTLHFEGVSSSATLTISTSSQRAFLDNITVVAGQKDE